MCSHPYGTACYVTNAASPYFGSRAWQAMDRCWACCGEGGRGLQLFSALALSSKMHGPAGAGEWQGPAGKRGAGVGSGETWEQLAPCTASHCPIRLSLPSVQVALGLRTVITTSVPDNQGEALLSGAALPSYPPVRRNMHTAVAHARCNSLGLCHGCSVGEGARRLCKERGRGAGCIESAASPLTMLG